jgi:hypothetical protein
MPQRINVTTIGMDKDIKNMIASAKLEGESWDELLKDMFNKACSWEEEHAR